MIVSAPERNGDIDSKKREASGMHDKLEIRRVMVFKPEVKGGDGESKVGPIQGSQCVCLHTFLMITKGQHRSRGTARKFHLQCDFAFYCSRLADLSHPMCRLTCP